MSGDWDLGEYPISNRFLQTDSQEVPRYPLILSQDQSNGLISVKTPAPFEEFIPRYPWLTETEPTDYMHSLAGKIWQLTGISRDAKIVGISQKDDLLIKYLRKKGFNNVFQIMRNDLGIHDNLNEIVRVQAELSRAASKWIFQKYQQAEVLLVNHILHHVHNLDSFFSTMRHLMTSNGVAVFEVPDYTRELESLDYTSFFDEHVNYFTRDTFKYLLATYGFEIIDFYVHPYPIEDSIIAITQRTDNPPSPMPKAILQQELERFETYKKNFEPLKQKIKQYLLEYKQNIGPIALYGAGHHACSFIHLFELAKVISFVADDNSNKQGMLMPGFQVPILHPDQLLHRGIKLCILSVSQLHEEKVAGKLSSFVQKGGTFSSVYPLSSHAMSVFKKN